MLPADYRWLDSPEGSYLRHGYRCVAIVRPGRVTILRGRKSRPELPLEGAFGSVEQGKRHVERWVAARLSQASGPCRPRSPGSR